MYIRYRTAEETIEAGIRYLFAVLANAFLDDTAEPRRGILVL